MPKNVFTTDDSKIMNPATSPKYFSKFLTQNNFPHIRFHDFRHTSVTLLVNNNFYINTVFHKLEHTITTTNLHFYVHNLVSADKFRAELLDNILVKNKAISLK